MSYEIAPVVMAWLKSDDPSVLAQMIEAEPKLGPEAYEVALVKGQGERFESVFDEIYTPGQIYENGDGTKRFCLYRSKTPFQVIGFVHRPNYLILEGEAREAAETHGLPFQGYLQPEKGAVITFYCRTVPKNPFGIVFRMFQNGSGGKGAEAVRFLDVPTAAALLETIK